MNQQMKILKEIARIADGDDFYNQAKAFGKTASKAFDSGTRRQMKNLENISNSSLKVTDVLDYVKKQVAKAEKPKTWWVDDFGIKLKDFIENDLRDFRGRVCAILEGVEEDSAEGQRIYLNLIREFVRQLVVHYEYCLANGGEPHGGK